MPLNITAQQEPSPGQHLRLFAVLVVLMKAHQQRAHAEVVQELPRVPCVLCMVVNIRKSSTWLSPDLRRTVYSLLQSCLPSPAL